MMLAQPSKPTVLVVEDEAGPRQALKVILRPFFNIQAAEDGQAALKLLREHSVDLITLDQKLPDRPGIELLQDIKLEHPTVEVIIITGYGSLKSAMEGIRHGAAGYLLKPFNVTELITLVNQTLEKKQRLDCLREFLKVSTSFWGTEPETEQLWQRLSEQYLAVAKAKHDPQTRFGTCSELVPLLSDLLEAKDRQLFNHSSRVSFYSTLFANPLDLTPAEQKSLGLGAFLHDIGYLGLDDRLVMSCAHLSDRDRETKQRHPDLGARLIQPLGLPAEVGQIISYHHERFDGSGYPYGLQGEGIPLFARIVSIAEVLDNLTSGRTGHTAVSVEEAVKQIAVQAGTGFDPMLVNLFTQVMTEWKASLPALAISTHQASLQDLPGEPGVP